MADTLLVIQPGTLPEGYCWPASPDSFQQTILGLARAVFPGNINGVVYGPNTPSSDDWDKLWVRTDAQGNLIRVYTHGGYGIWVSPHPVSPGSIRQLWVGAEASLETYDEGTSDAVTAVTGPFWEVDHDFDFKTLIGPGTNSVVYDGGSATTITVGGNGGVERVAISEDELPSHKFDVNTFGASGGDPLVEIANKWSGDDTGGGKITTGASALNGGDDTLIQAKNPFFETESLGGDKSHDNMPPYRGIFVIKRTNRVYHTAS